MSIWFKKDTTPGEFAHWGKNSMVEHVGIRFTEVGEDYIKASMPVDHRTVQSYGILHGGASVVLAETVGSVASALVIDLEKYVCVGLEINANHIRSVRSGMVVATCTPIHLGRTTHVWDIRINSEEKKLVCICRLTVAVIEREKDKMKLNFPEAG